MIDLLSTNLLKNLINVNTEKRRSALSLRGVATWQSAAQTDSHGAEEAPRNDKIKSCHCEELRRGNLQPDQIPTHLVIPATFIVIPATFIVIPATFIVIPQ